jgi:molybdopterin synthase sulfur carrier subunit
MKSVTVHYFAILRDQRGLAEERVATNAATASELYAELGAQHGFTLAERHLRVAVNEEFAAWSAALGDGDALAFIPPVAGG